MKLNLFTALLTRLRYSLKTSTLLAHGRKPDGSNAENCGFLFRTSDGRYFWYLRQISLGRLNDSIEPATLEDAVYMYRHFPFHEVEFDTAFPGYNDTRSE